MKKLFLFSLLLIILCKLAESQGIPEFWGMTSDGGNGGGVIFKTNADGTNIEVVKKFVDYNGSRPNLNEFCELPTGKLYGTTCQGGTYGNGILFEYDPATSTFVKKFDFDGTNGTNPYGKLLLASNGKLYGMTCLGGSSGNGVLYEFNILSGVLTKKIDFNNTYNGSRPRGGLIQASNGNIYGMTTEGGSVNWGTIFEYDPVTNILTRKFNFTGSANGQYPYGSLMQATNGKLYGVTVAGGSGGYGCIFEYDYSTSTYTKKIDFDNTNTGRESYSTLIEANGSKLYGTSYKGGSSGYGVIYEYDPVNNICTKKIDFSGQVNGKYPFGGLCLASNGKLYGNTNNGGSGDYGVLFEYDPSSNTCTIVNTFSGYGNGANPNGTLVKTSSGKLYGMASQGGISYSGVIFEYDISASTFSKKLDFCDWTAGKAPNGGIIQANDGKLYGLIYRGGANDGGILFVYDPNSCTFTKKVDFTGTANGKGPYGDLMQASNGKIYGMTYSGGTSNYGVIFEFDPATGLLTKKVDLTATIGITPQGNLIQASNGKLYGMMQQGGSGYGTLFEYDISSNTVTKKFDFSGTNGTYPRGSPIQAADEKLYGLTYQGGANGQGALFEYDIVTSSYTKKADFSGTVNGSYPHGNLVQASNGKLYGLTNSGGANNNGTLFEYDIATSALTKKIDFAGAANGSNPRGSLMKATNGKLYGMAYSGGANNVGVIFEFDPDSGILTKKADFTTANGKFPAQSSLIEIMSDTTETLYSGTGCWNDNSKWSDGVPTSRKKAVVNGYCTLTGDNAAKKLTINPGKSLTINSGSYLNVYDSIVLKSDTSGYASLIDYGSLSYISSKTVIENFIKGSGRGDTIWHFYSSPVSSATADVFSYFYVDKWYEPTDQWMPLTSGNQLQPGRGYACFYTGNISQRPDIKLFFRGQLNSGLYNLPVSHSNALGTNDDNWNLAGNPYPSAVDMYSFSGSSNTESSVSYWVATAGSDFRGQFATYNFSSNIGNNGGQRYVPAMQGFFIKTTGVSPQLYLWNELRTPSSQDFYKSINQELNTLRLISGNNDFKDETVVACRSSASLFYEDKSDSRKLFSSYENVPSLYTMSSDQVMTSINCIPELEDGQTLSLAVGFKSGINGIYRIQPSGTASFDSTVMITLEDILINSTVDLKRTPSYIYNYSTTDDDIRFFIHFSKLNSEINENRTEPMVFCSHDKIYVSNNSGVVIKVCIYDMLGRLIISKQTSTSFIYDMNENDAGYYIVQVSTYKGVTSKKVIVFD